MKRDARQILTELLVLQSQNGDQWAFTMLHELWRADTERMAYASCGDGVGAADIAQEAWVAVARGLSKLQDPACFPSWLFQVVRRRSADWVRGRQRERAVRDAAVADAEQSAREQGDRSEATESPLRRAIDQLGETDRELLSLFYELGRSVREIGEILDVPTGTVKSRLFKLRERLKTEIEKETS